MDNTSIEHWRDTAIAVEKERLKMLENADKANRKERIATALMAGIYSNSAHADMDYRIAANCAIYGADALIAELDRKEQ